MMRGSENLNTPSPPQRSIIARVFVSVEEPRLRAGWRLLLHTILLFLFMILFSIPAMGLLFLLEFGFEDLLNPTPFVLLLNAVVSLIGFTASVYIARRWFDRRSFTSLGLIWNDGARRDLLVGIGITAVQMGLIFLAELAFGWLRFEGFTWQVNSFAEILSGLIVYGLAFLIVGWYEELLSRGYHLQNLADGLNMPWAVLLSSAVFGVLHIFNPNASLISTLGILAAGLFLAYGYLRTRQLWLPIGLHIGWNFFEGVIFGFPVSGTQTFKLLLHSPSGPDLLTGGAFGPEAGLILLPALALGAFFIWWYTREPAE